MWGSSKLAHDVFFVAMLSLRVFLATQFYSKVLVQVRSRSRFSLNWSLGQLSETFSELS